MYPKNPTKFKALDFSLKKKILDLEKKKKKKNLPVDLEFEILQRLPLRSAVRMCAVSKYWSELMKTEKFSEGFLSLSLEKPCILFVSSSIIEHPQCESEKSTVHCMRFCSILKEKSHGLFIQKPTVHPVLESDCDYEISRPVHGLLCCYKDNKSVLCNPSGRYFDLPNVSKDADFFLGFDPIYKELKVLAIAKYDFCTEILTILPDGNRAWRTLDSPILHGATSHGLCLGGNIYYIAVCEDYTTYCLMCFNLSTEEFSQISLPQEIEVENHFLFRAFDGLVIFKDKLAIARDLYAETGDLTIWILEDGTKWYKQHFLVLAIREVFETDSLKFIGTARTGQLIYAPHYDKFTPDFGSTMAQYVAYYDPIKQIVEKVRIEGDFSDFAGRIEPFLDYTENPALSPIGPPF